ncbi:uncharacterized oxidoreductase TM_0325-like isoform X2 [Bufo gargarizans]|uniref:uncharacterized oxidoreductase TM_0325-like isoform X2 n=1 Tax=Bufo gargarizans TaxID=30331 RepID=UPI001CF44180|nr:uncharacterized oxidoreductase TM_0325-like isoform X2 [Bufo gargarizans]
MAAARGTEQVVSLRGKVCLVTGASSGIGAGTALLFARLGARLALNGRNEEKLKETARGCEEFCDQKPLLVLGDLADEAVVRGMVEQTVAHFGQLDVLVNNAAIMVMGSIEDTTLQDYDRMMNVNVRSVLYLTQLAVPHLIKTKGNIVNVSSVAGLRSSRDHYDGFTSASWPERGAVHAVSGAQQANPHPGAARQCRGSGPSNCLPGFRCCVFYHWGHHASRRWTPRHVPEITV